MDLSPEIPTIVTERLVITIPGAEAAAAVAAFFAGNRAHLAPWSPPQPPEMFQEEFWARRLPAFREEYARDVTARFVAFSGDGPLGPVVGTCSFTQIFRGPFQACFLGYGIGARFEGKGMMFEALEATIDFMFESRRIHRVMANYVPTNERSGRLLRRLGFAVEGYARDYLFIDGAWRDHVLTALTNPRIERP